MENKTPNADSWELANEIKRDFEEAGNTCGKYPLHERIAVALTIYAEKKIAEFPSDGAAAEKIYKRICEQGASAKTDHLRKVPHVKLIATVLAAVRAKRDKEWEAFKMEVERVIEYECSGAEWMAQVLRDALAALAGKAEEERNMRCSECGQNVAHLYGKEPKLGKPIAPPAEEK